MPTSLIVTAAEPTGSGPTTPTAVAPPSSDETLSPWIDLSHILRRVSVAADDAATAARAPLPAPPADRAADVEAGEQVSFTRYTLHRALLCCGVKQHRVRQSIDHILAQLLSEVYTATTPVASRGTPVVFLDSESLASTSSPSPARQLPVPLPVLVADWLARSASDTDGGVGERDCYRLHVPASTWKKAVIKCLGGALRGQMISLRPLLRWNMVCAQQSGRVPVVIFISGTSGAGKSTLASLVASQLRIPNVLSTDTVRQVLRTRLRGKEAQYASLFVSTYEAHTTLQHTRGDDEAAADAHAIVRAYEAQCELVLGVLDGMLARLVARRESIVVEGVHLLPRYVAAKRAELLVSRVVCVPVLVRIPKADSHLERFCVRARGMSMQSPNNKYIASFHAIRAIQAHLVNSVETASLPVLVLTNTNVDKTFTVLHHALLETMEYVAVHGWPEAAAAAAGVPLTALVFTAVKDRLVTVVRQRRGRHCSTAGDHNRHHHHHHHHPSASSPTGTSEVEDSAGGHGRSTTDFSGAPPSASQTRQSALIPLPGIGTASRARSVELLSAMQRRLIEQGHHCHQCDDCDGAGIAVAARSLADAAGVRDAGTRLHAYPAARRSSTTDVKPHLIPATSSRRRTNAHDEVFDEVEVPSLIGS
ncbi:AAA domain containing protein [Novymonas esmeraldas]|uniref:AAA domain containing protein n=1 Tax=Novymonas esmeraldas TaxID=1808958 RepID=A0AAW0EUT7_9TRYP